MFPDYDGGSIANLMSSLSKALGAKSQYKQLKLLKANDINHKNVVLLVIDGLGYNFLQKYGKNFKKYLEGSMTSVFPPTTGAAIPTYMLGVPPQQHGLTGWFQYDRDIGGVCLPLRYCMKNGAIIDHVDPSVLFTEPSFFDKIDRRSFLIQSEDFIFSPGNSVLGGFSAERYPCSTFTGLLRQLRRALKQKGNKYIYAYWHEFDILSHREGPEHEETIEHFTYLEEAVIRFAKTLDKDTLLIVSADHGHQRIDNTIDIADHPKLQDMLTLPLTGDARTAYAYVKPGKEKQFKSYMKKHFSHACEVRSSDYLIKKGVFGKFKEHPKLRQRIGTHVILMNEDWRIWESQLDDGPLGHIGSHSGTTENEMLVPLLVFRK